MQQAYLVRAGRANAYLGRWHEVRAWHARGCTPPLVLDRRQGTITYQHQRYWTELDGALYPAVRGGAGWDTSTQHERISLVTSILNVSLQNTALDSAYTYNSAGDAVAGRYNGPAKTLTSIYFRMNAKTGTIPGNDLDWEIRDETGSNKPGANIQSGGSGTIDITSITAPSWISASSLSVSLSAGTPYWACIADKSAVDASNNATITRSAAVFTNVKDILSADGCSSTNGFNTISGDGRVQNIVWGFSDGTSAGDPFTGNGAGSSNTDRRGIYFSTGFTEQIKFWGMALNTSITNVSGLEIYPSSAAVPGTGALSIGSLFDLRTASLLAGYGLQTPYTFAKSTGYRCVFTYSGASTSLSTYSIGTGADSVLAQSMLGGGGWYWARANGTTNWNNDDTFAFPRCFIFLDNQVEIAGGGGGAGPLVGPGRLIR